MEVQNNDNTNNKNEISDEKKDNEKDEIDLMIENISKHTSFNLLCPTTNNNFPCKSILRLVKQCIIYKRWLNTVYKKTNGNNNIEQTIEINIEKFIDNKTFKNVYITNVQ